MDDPLPQEASRYTRPAEEFAQREPTKAIVSAFAVGAFLTILPLGAIAGILVKAALSLLRPALYFLGLMKLCEFCQAKCRK